MGVFRINKTKDYTTMSNNHLRNKQLSLKAKGLLSVMLSLPDDWDYSINGLVAISKENQTAIENALKELKQFGYLSVDKVMPDKTESGRIEYNYNVYEYPQKQGVENQPLEILGVENRPQLNTNQSMTKKLKTNNNIDINEIIDNFTQYEPLRVALEEFVKMRKTMKKPITSYGLQQCLTKRNGGLNDLSNGNDQVATEIVNQSIERGWLGLFPIKNNESRGGAVVNTVSRIARL